MSRTLKYTHSDVVSEQNTTIKLGWVLEQRARPSRIHYLFPSHSFYRVMFLSAVWHPPSWS